MNKILSLLFLVCPLFLIGQSKYYSNPVKIPMLLSGSFAELRNNHFHSGIDIKTQGITGIPVYAVAEGYISRINVSSGGFGYALYVNHPNGTTSVYGHLNHFRSDIDEYVKNKQYEQKSFGIDFQVLPYLFPVKKGEQIANSGNSGSSGGPHLHFEIRNTLTEEPLNPLKYGFEVKDGTAPSIYSLLIVPLNDSSHVNYKSAKSSFPVVSNSNSYFIENKSPVPVFGEIGFAIQTNDFFDGSKNRCGIYSLELFIDQELYFSYQMDRFSFEKSKYINSHIVYDTYVSSRRKYQKTWLEPGNQLEIYGMSQNNGVFSAKNENIHSIEIILKDSQGNTSRLEFKVEGKSGNNVSFPKQFSELFTYDIDNHYKSGDIELDFPAYALDKDLNFQIKKFNSKTNYFSDLHSIHSETVPLFKKVKIRIKTKNLIDSLHSKALLVKVDTLKNRFYPSGGEYKNGWIASQISTFGAYAVMVDTIAPRIVPLSIKDKKSLSESTQIRFKISDDLSGIKEIEGFLDGKWALIEYDSKSGLIRHQFDSTRFDLKKRHLFQLRITDYKDNSSDYEASFWK